LIHLHRLRRCIPTEIDGHGDKCNPTAGDNKCIPREVGGRSSRQQIRQRRLFTQSRQFIRTHLTKRRGYVSVYACCDYEYTPRNDTKRCTTLIIPRILKRPPKYEVDETSVSLLLEEKNGSEMKQRPHGTLLKKD